MFCAAECNGLSIINTSKTIHPADTDSTIRTCKVPFAPVGNMCFHQKQDSKQHTYPTLTMPIILLLLSKQTKKTFASALETLAALIVIISTQAHVHGRGRILHRDHLPMHTTTDHISLSSQHLHCSLCGHEGDNRVQGRTAQLKKCRKRHTTLELT